MLYNSHKDRVWVNVFSGTGSRGSSWIEAVKQDVANVTYLLLIRWHEICSRHVAVCRPFSWTSPAGAPVLCALVLCALPVCGLVLGNLVLSPLVAKLAWYRTLSESSSEPSLVNDSPTSIHTLVSPPIRGQMALLYKCRPPSEDVAKRPHIDLNIWMSFRINLC